MMVIDNQYEIGQTVYLITDKEQEQRIVYGFEITQGSILYMLCIGTTSSKHFDFEIAKERDEVKQMTN
jgi:hypothetical protein